MDKNIKVIKYKPYGRAARTIKHELWLYIEPVETVIDGVVYRHIPMYKEICVSKLGVIKKSKTHKPVKCGLLTGYPTIMTNDCLNESYVMVRTHRLVALAWIPNNDFINKNIVDHIDENKSNCVVSNLRWVTASENLSLKNHGILKRYTVVNLKTGFTVRRDSLCKVADYLCLSHQRLSTKKLPFKIVGRTGDTYSVIDTKVNKPITTDTLMVDKPKFVVTKIGDASHVEHFMTKHEVGKKHGIGCYPFTIKNISKALNKKGYKLKDLYNVSVSNKYDIHNIKTKEELNGLLLKEVINVVKCSRSTLLTRINRDYRYGQIFNGWVLKLSNEPVYTVNYRAGGGESYTIQPKTT